MSKDNKNISLKNHFEEVIKLHKESIDQRFKNIDDRFLGSEKNVASALASQKELSQTVQLSSDKAITKAEESQKEYNKGHNDLSRKMEDQYKEMLPRNEADQRQINTEEKLESHRKELVILQSRMDEWRGKGSVTDPLINDLMIEMKKISLVISTNIGKNEGTDKTLYYIFAIVGFLGTIFGIYMGLKN